MEPWKAKYRGQISSRREFHHAGMWFRPCLAQTGNYANFRSKVAKITRNGRQIDGRPRVHQIDGRFLALCHALTELFLFRPFEPKQGLNLASDAPAAYVLLVLAVGGKYTRFRQRLL